MDMRLRDESSWVRQAGQNDPLSAKLQSEWTKCRASGRDVFPVDLFRRVCLSSVLTSSPVLMASSNDFPFSCRRSAKVIVFVSHVDRTLLSVAVLTCIHSTHIYMKTYVLSASTLLSYGNAACAAPVSTW